ncbi:MAG TPA: S1/P1 nuclease [Azospira sp.]|nr:S1/P1 nuclease [Azospira sp.]
MRRPHRPFGRLRPVGLVLLLLAASAPALAWNAAGHRLSAAIAWREMAPATRAAVGKLLAAHPEHPRWLARGKEADIDYAAFLAASTWADDIKRDRRFYDEGTPPSAAQAGYPEMARHRHWHHADQPLDGRGRGGDGELDRRLPQLMRTLGDRQASASARSYALPWLIHLVADAHQPLHVVSRYDATGNSDRGGNGLWVETPHHPRLREMTLHAYWDDLPGPPWLRGERLEAAATALGNSLPDSAARGRSRGDATDVAGWIADSRQLARTVAYTDLDGEAPVIDERYHERARRTAERQIVLAGRRLARLLEQLLGDDVSRGTANRTGNK